MKFAYKAYFATLLLLTLVFSAAAQNGRSEKDTRNTAPTVGTGGPIGGPTGLFTVYDGQTLRKGEYTFSAAYSNYDRDPGDADITDWPVSFQIGVTNNVELFFNTNVYRRIKINSPANLSSFYLPNSRLVINGVATSGPAIVFAPQGGFVGPYQGTAVFRPTGTQPFVSFPYMGGNAGTYGIAPPFFSGNVFGFANNANALLGNPFGSNGSAAASFPGVGSIFGSILPGVVLATVQLTTPAGVPAGTAPTVFSTVPSYLPDAPFVNTTFGRSTINDFEIGAKIRLNKVDSKWGHGFTVFYRYNVDKANSLNGFSQLQNGSGTGGNRGDFGAIYFVDARLAWWANLSANIGLVHNSSVHANFANGQFTILDRGDELQTSIAADFPVNKHFQWIVEFRDLHYVGGRTPNAFEVNPMDLIGGLRFFPRRWWGVGVAYRRMMNQQNADAFKNTPQVATAFVPCPPNVICQARPPIITTISGLPTNFRTSSDPNGLIAQIWVGRREKRTGDVKNNPANVDSLDLSGSVVTLPCKPGSKSRSGGCNDNRTVGVTTKASDADNDPLVYNYTVSGGRIVGSGANVQWDLGGAQAGTYTITAGVDDGCGICGKTQTKTVTVQECTDCFPVCSCPTLTVSGPAGVTNPGDTMTFTANVSGGPDVTYNWTVSAGTIESGQGTPSITVRTTREMGGSNVTATVELIGLDKKCDCPSTGSETAGVIKIKTDPVDEFGKLKDDDVKARMDPFFIRLNSDPTAKGFIINYGTAAQIKARRAQIMKAVKFRKFDPGLLTFVDAPSRAGDKEVWTKLILVPAGAGTPTADNPNP